MPILAFAAAAAALVRHVRAWRSGRSARPPLWAGFAAAALLGVAAAGIASAPLLLLLHRVEG